MSRPVSFHRKARGNARMGEGLRLFELHLSLAKEVDSESGMTLNLTEVDRILSDFWKHVQTQEFADIRELLSVARVFLVPRCQRQGAELQTLTFRDPLVFESAEWRLSEPTQAWSIESRPVRFQGLVSGWARIRRPWRAPVGGAGATVHELSWAPASATADQIMAALDPEAVEVFFQDEFSGKTWRWEK